MLFTISAFNSDVSMGTAGTFDASAAVALDTDADATLYISTTQMKNTFKFSTESTNFDDVSVNDVRYYVYQDQWTGFTDASLNVVNAQVLTGAVVTTNSKSVAYLPKEMLVKHDFIRYISNNLFNTPYGTDLFSNETELITDLNNLGDITTGVLFQINAKLANCDVSGGDVAIYTDTSGDVMYATDVQSEPTNISRELLRQMYAASSSRFSGLSTNTINSIPFIDGDIITFKLTVDAELTQHTLTGVEPILPRTYTISLTLTDDLITNSNPVPTL
jgi:hypothetical protein